MYPFYQKDPEEEEEDIDMNGAINAISSGQKHQTEIETNKKKKSKGGGVLASIMKGLCCILHCFQVENPHHIDNYSRLSFPLCFIIINVFYWVYYLYFWSIYATEYSKWSGSKKASEIIMLCKMKENNYLFFVKLCKSNEYNNFYIGDV